MFMWTLWCLFPRHVKRENFKMARQYNPHLMQSLRTPSTWIHFKLTVRRKSLYKDFHCPPFQIHPRGHRNVSCTKFFHCIAQPWCPGQNHRKTQKPLHMSSLILCLEKDSHQCQMRSATAWSSWVSKTPKERFHHLSGWHVKTFVLLSGEKYFPNDQSERLLMASQSCNLWQLFFVFMICHKQEFTSIFLRICLQEVTGFYKMAPLPYFFGQTKTAQGP